VSNDKRLFLALAICAAAILLLDFLLPPRPKPKAPPRKPVAAVKPEAVNGANGAAAAGGGAGAPLPPPPLGGPFRNEEPAAVPSFPLVSGRLHAVMHSRGASLGRLWLRGVSAKPGSDAGTEEGALTFLEDAAADQPGALAVSLVAPRFDTVNLEARNWELVSKPGAIPIVWRARALAEEKEPGKGLLVEKRFYPTDDPGGWHVRMEVSVTNTDPALERMELDLRVRGSALVHSPEGARDALYGRAKLRNTASPKTVTGPQALDGVKKREPKTVEGDVDWVGTTTTYFAAILDPDEPAEGKAPGTFQVRWDGLTPATKEKGGLVLPQPSPVVSIPMGVPAVGETRTATFRFFVGLTANEAVLEKEYRPVLNREEYQGYRPIRDPGWFDLIGQGLFYVLKGFHSLVPNWGVSIVLLTVLVRGLMFPLSRKQMKSTIDYSRKMQKVKPKLDAMREKHGKDKQRMAQEQMRLFKEHDVPLLPGGCLLTFLQLPIWIALYGMLQSNYDLRHATFLWVQDLSQADHLWEILPGVHAIPMVPDALQWLNLLPLLMTATWFFSSKAMQTPPADEQQAQMQAMMQWMPFIMLLFPGFYTMPAGLCLYITASSTWGIVESRIIRKRLGAT
jgi:YidC/Oxa1 family membrane protein insertase